LDVAAIERRDETPPHRHQDRAGDFIRLRLTLDDQPVAVWDFVVPSQQLTQRLGAGHHCFGMTNEQIEKALFLRHERLEPPEHSNPRPGARRGS
jgi:hypothetical protein